MAGTTILDLYEQFALYSPKGVHTRYKAFAKDLIGVQSIAGSGIKFGALTSRVRCVLFDGKPFSIESIVQGPLKLGGFDADIASLKGVAEERCCTL